MLSSSSSGIKNNQSLCSLLVHDPVTALSASDWITGLNFIFSVTFSTYVDHRLLFGRLYFFLWIHFCFSLFISHTAAGAHAHNRRPPLSKVVCDWPEDTPSHVAFFFFYQTTLMNMNIWQTNVTRYAVVFVVYLCWGCSWFKDRNRYVFVSTSGPTGGAVENRLPKRSIIWRTLSWPSTLLHNNDSVDNVHTLTAKTAITYY